MRDRAIYLPLTDKEKTTLEQVARERETNQRQVLRDAIRAMAQKEETANNDRLQGYAPSPAIVHG